MGMRAGRRVKENSEDKDWILENRMEFTLAMQGEKALRVFAVDNKVEVRANDGKMKWIRIRCVSVYIVSSSTDSRSSTVDGWLRILVEI